VVLEGRRDPNFVKSEGEWKDGKKDRNQTEEETEDRSGER
jgi:hypothetical protein